MKDFRIQDTGRPEKKKGKMLSVTKALEEIKLVFWKHIQSYDK